MVHLESIRRKPVTTAQTLRFPFGVPIIHALTSLQFQAPVTFLVGENGSGKSTLLEALACAIGSVTVGSENVRTDPTLAEVRRLAETFALSWKKKTHRGFFLRAEDFFGFAKRIQAMRAEAAAELDDIDRDYEGRSELAKMLAKGPHANTVGALRSSYGDGLDAQSHGESFLKLFQSRLVPDALYLLDEPEVPLSPLRQLAFLSMLKDTVSQGCQYIIATHSPILLAFPGACILSCDTVPIERVAYQDLEHYTLTRDFLNNPEQFLSRL